MSNSRSRLKLAIAALVIALTLPVLALAEAGAERSDCRRGPGAGKGGAHRGPDPGHFLDRHGDELGLDAETRESIQAIVDGSREQSEPIRDEIRDEHKALRALMSQASPDEAAVMSQHDRVEALKSQQHKNRLQAMLEIRKLLTPEQREQLVEIREERRRGRGEGRECSDDAGPGGCGKDCPMHRRGRLAGCREDVASLCAEAEPGRERLRCLDAEWESLSDDCRAAFEGRGRRGPRPSQSVEPEAE